MNIFFQNQLLSSFRLFWDLKLHNSNLSYFDVGKTFFRAEKKEKFIDFVLNTLRSYLGTLLINT